MEVQTPRAQMQGRGEHTLVPCVLDTRVLPTLRLVNRSGALMSYHCFLVNGSTLQNHEKPGKKRHQLMKKEEEMKQILDRDSAEDERGEGGTHAFFLLPFLPLEMRLFLPTAMVAAAGGVAALRRLGA